MNMNMALYIAILEGECRLLRNSEEEPGSIFPSLAFRRLISYTPYSILPVIIVQVLLGCVGCGGEFFAPD